MSDRQKDLGDPRKLAQAASSVGSALSEVVGLPTLYARWLSIRVPIGVVTVVLGVVLWLVLDWTGPLIVAGLGLILLADIVLRKRGALRSPLSAIFTDTTLMSLAILVLAPPASVVAMPFAYLIATTFLLVSWKRAASLVVYQLGWMTVLLMGPAMDLWVPADGRRAMIAAAIMASLFVFALVSMFSHAGMALGEVRRSLTERFLYEQAVAECSRALLISESEAAVEGAISVLLDATGADAVYVDRNFEHPVDGLSTRIVHEAVREGAPQPSEDDAWNGGPYSDLPTTFAALSAGEPCLLHTRDLVGVEHEIYERDGIISELDIPIQSSGKWVGSIAFSSYVEEGNWKDEDIALLQTAAEMIGAFWERNHNRDELKGAFQRLDHRFNLERALANSARALLSEAASPLTTALEELLAATGADFVFVDENFENPDRGLCTKIIAFAEDHDAQPTDATSEWWGGSYADLPTAYSALSNGQPSLILTSQLEGAERAIYEADGLLSELCIPINVSGEWRGSIAFTDYRTEHLWTDVDIAFLETAAELIGAYWEREANKETLEVAILSLDTRARYEESLARCSQALLSDAPEALDLALEHLLEGTHVDYLWLEENYRDKARGFSARIIADVNHPETGKSNPPDGWFGGPHSETPTSFLSLERGEPSIIHVEELTGPERDLYEIDGLKSELMLPIFVFGEWFGAIGFADYHSTRNWHEQDLQILRTGAQMIGSFLERRQTRSRLEDLVRSKDEFIASVSHELRTPLTSVLGFTEVLLSGEGVVEVDERKELLGLIGREAQEVAWIVEDLLAFARADIGTLAASVVDISVADQTRAVLAGQPQDLVSRVTVVGDDQRALADPGRVRQIVRNLLTNAFRYGGPNVLVRVGQEDDVTFACVVDDGDGIPEDQRILIFDAYHSAHERGGQPGSVGLGLNVSRKLARVMGGDLTYSYEDGHSVFRLSLPMAESRVATTT